MQHFYKDDNMNIFRLPVGWQYLTNNVVGGDLDATNFGKYDELMQSCLDLGAKVRDSMIIPLVQRDFKLRERLANQNLTSVLLISTTMPVGTGRSSAKVAQRTTVSSHVKLTTPESEPISCTHL